MVPSMRRNIEGRGRRQVNVRNRTSSARKRRRRINRGVGAKRRSPRRRRRRTRGRTPAAIDADHAIGQLNTSIELSTHPTNVSLSASNLKGDATLAEIGPSAVRELDGTALVGTAQTLTVSAVGAEGEPERVLTSAVINIGPGLRTPSLPIGGNAVVTVGEQVHAVDLENDERRKLSAVEQRLHVLVDDRVVDVRADLSARIGDERVKRDNLTKRSADRGITRQPRREIRRRNSRRHGKKKAIGTQPDSPKGSSTGSAGRWPKPPGAPGLRIKPYTKRGDHRARPWGARGVEPERCQQRSKDWRKRAP